MRVLLLVGSVIAFAGAGCLFYVVLWRPAETTDSYMQAQRRRSRAYWIGLGLTIFGAALILAQILRS